MTRRADNEAMKPKNIRERSERDGGTRNGKRHLTPALSPTEAERVVRDAGERLLTKQEMADRLQVDLRTVERWMAMGVLRPLRIHGVVRFIWVEVVEALRAKCEVRSARGEGEGKQKVENRNLKAEGGAEGKAQRRNA